MSISLEPSDVGRSDLGPAVPPQRAQRRAGRRRALVWLVTFLAVDTAAYFAGSALHPRHHAAASPSCRLAVLGTTGGRDEVGYQDATGDAPMSAAIRSAVAGWNAAPDHVTLVASPHSGSPAIVFRAGAATLPVPTCRAAAPRTVVVTLGSAAWGSGSGPHAVRQPVAGMAKIIGAALGLHGEGRCPALMAKAACAHRDATPDTAEIAALDRLYP